MRVLMLNYEFPPLGGGAANATKYILYEFADTKELEVDLVTSSEDSYKEQEYSDNINIYKMDVKKEQYHHWKQSEIISYSLKAYNKARSLRKKEDYDLIHAFFTIPCGAIPYLGRFDEPFIV
ncbi:MAG: glycosyltransferase, partial [Archaeoglobaceae archaeon]